MAVIGGAVSDKEVREMVKDLIWGSNLIGSCVNGYFMIEDLSDYEIAKQHLLAPIAEIVKRGKQLDFLWQVKTTKQGDLPL